MLMTMEGTNVPSRSQRQPLIRQLASNLVRAHPMRSAPRQLRALGRMPSSAQGRQPLISAFEVEFAAAVELDAAAVELDAAGATAGAAAAAAASLHFGSLQ